MSRTLPVIEEQRSSLRSDGSRDWVHPADVKGRWTTIRRGVFAALIAFYAALPWIDVGGHPAVFIDLPERKFYFFGLTFNAQDAWLAFFLVTGVGFLLMLMAALLGRIWCGYACPQTVFLEGVYRRVERLIEGPRSKRLRRNAGPATFDKVWRKTLKNGIFIVLSVLVAHIFLSYFTSLDSLFGMVRASPFEHPEPFLWVWGISAALYLNFAFFREQLCLIVCPYGRLQSVLTDRDSIIVGYDEKRGEPRGKASDADAGDCVSCNRCVVVCPTGIDIRNGLQLDCIGCSNCIDACDEVMGKLGREPGLIRYDSLNGLEHKARRFFRPRLALYIVLGSIGLSVATLSIGGRQSFEATAVRMRGAPFAINDGRVLNSFELHLVNKDDEVRRFELRPLDDGPHTMNLPPLPIEVDALESRRLPLPVLVPEDRYEPGTVLQLEVTTEGEEPKVLELPILGPG
ncbi:MAG: cytochrome c oxidase accessory protein CcoG [Myxococcota bacterium]